MEENISKAEIKEYELNERVTEILENEHDLLDFIDSEYNFYTIHQLMDEINEHPYVISILIKRLKLPNKFIKPTNNISEIGNQILLSGIIGDGRFKLFHNKIGDNAIYSECHAFGELDYLTWKYLNLGDITCCTKMYDKNRNNSSNNAVEFNSNRFKELVPYAELNFEKNKFKVIEQLDELGLVLHLLDDGWFSEYVHNTNKPNGRFSITTYSWTKEERQCLADRWLKLTGIEFTDYGKKRINLGCSSEYNQQLFELATKYIPAETDIIQKKFKLYV